MHSTGYNVLAYSFRHIIILHCIQQLTLTKMRPNRRLRRYASLLDAVFLVAAFAWELGGNVSEGACPSRKNG
jgi:hypothetical protein